MAHATPLARFRRASRRGLTLVEVLVAVALVALLMGTIVFGRGMLASSRTRASATLIVSSVRFGLSRANSTGKPARLVLDFDQKKLSIEEASGGQMLREKGKDASAGASPTTEAEQRARAEVDKILEGPRPPRPSFVKLTGVSGGAEELAAGRPLGDGVELVSVQTEHDEEPVTEGRAYVYFWPGGTTERAAIYLRRAGDTDEEGLTVVLSALTGRAKIEKGRVELPEPRGTDEEYSEREEP